MKSDEQYGEGQHTYHLRGHAEMRSTDVSFRADQIDYDEEKGVVHLSGNVSIETAKKGVLHCDEADYDTKSGDLKLKMNLAPAR